MASTETAVIEQIRISEPRKHKVILHNDDKTTIEFVIVVLQSIFHKSLQESVEIATHVHVTGSAIVGIYTKEIADEKVVETTALARANGYPLMTTHEEL